MPGDSNYTSVSLLLHCDGTNGSTTFTDTGPGARTVTRTGTPTITTAQSKWGGASADMPGSGSYLTSAAGAQWDFGTGNFCVEMWVRSTTTSSFQTIASTNSWTTGDGDWALYTRHGGFQKVTFTYKQDINFVQIDSSTVNVHDGSWHHVAVTRSGSTIRIFVDGSQLGSATYAGQIGRSDKVIALGAHVGDGRSFTGNLDDIRITKGVARYTGAFSVPTEAFPDSLPSDMYVQGRSGLGSGSAQARIQFSSVQGRSGLGTGSVLASDPAKIRVQGRSPLGSASLRLWRQDAVVLGTTALGRASALARQQSTQVQGRSGLGSGAVRATFPQAARVQGRSPLGSARITAWHDFTGAVSATSTLAYVMDLIGPGGTVRVPISSWQATLQTDAACYVQCVVPACLPWVETIAAATQFVIYRRATTTAGSSIEYEMARSPVETRSYAQGGFNYTCTISGYPDALTPNASPPTVYDRTLSGVRAVFDGDGGMRVTSDIDWLLRPGMRAYYGAVPILVDYINYYVPGSDQYMIVGERA